MWTVEELADAWKVSREWVRRMLRSGDLRGQKRTPGGPWRIRDADAAAFWDAPHDEPVEVVEAVLPVLPVEPVTPVEAVEADDEVGDEETI